MTSSGCSSPNRQDREAPVSLAGRARVLHVVGAAPGGGHVGEHSPQRRGSEPPQGPRGELQALAGGAFEVALALQLPFDLA